MQIFMRKSRKALWGISEKRRDPGGSDADIVVLDPEKESVISAKTHAYNTDNNPFEGFALHCAIDDVFLRGHHAVQDGKLKEEKLGTFIPRGKNTLEAEK